MSQTFTTIKALTPKQRDYAIKLARLAMNAALEADRAFGDRRTLAGWQCIEAELIDVLCRLHPEGNPDGSN